MNINELLSNMEHYAKENNVPIMLNDGINYLTNYIKENNIKKVLEIGTAIGYSTIKIRNTGAYITSIERDEERYNIALENVKLSKLDNINLILGDALDVTINDKYDLIFVDAAKGKNLEFINKYKDNLNEGGIFIIDNVDFHGLVGKSNEIKSRNLRALVRKIERFLNYLDNQNEYEVSKINVGDGLIVLRRCKDE